MPEVLLFKNYSHVVYLWHETVVKRKDIAATSKKFPNYRGFQSISITARINDIRPNTKSKTKSLVKVKIFRQNTKSNLWFESKPSSLFWNPHRLGVCVFELHFINIQSTSIVTG